MFTAKNLLEEHFVRLQYESGKTWSQLEFAIYIGEDPKYLNMVINGRKPSKRQTILFAEVFNDPRFYDAAGMERPEKYIDYLKRNWANVPAEMRKQIAEQIGPYTTEKPPDDP